MLFIASQVFFFHVSQVSIKSREVILMVTSAHQATDFIPVEFILTSKTSLNAYCLFLILKDILRLLVIEGLESYFTFGFQSVSFFFFFNKIFLIKTLTV